MARAAAAFCLLVATAAATQATVQFPFDVVSGSFTVNGAKGSFGPSQLFQTDWKTIAGNSKEFTLALSIPNGFSGEAKFPATPLTADGFAFCAAFKTPSGPGCKVVAGGLVELEGVLMGATPVTLVIRPVKTLGGAAASKAAAAPAAAQAAAQPQAPAPGAPAVGAKPNEDKDLKDVKDDALAQEEKITKDEISKLEDQLTPDARKRGRMHRLKRRLHNAMKEIKRLRKASAKACPNCPAPPQPVKTMTAAEYAERAAQYIDVTPVNDLAEEDRKLRDMGLTDKLAVDPKTLHHGKWLNIAIAGEHKHFVKTHEKNCADPICPLGADVTAQPAIAVP